MKILQQNAGLLTNAEVLLVLRDRGCATGVGLSNAARSQASEKVLFQHLSEHSRPALSRVRLQAFIDQVQPFNLMRIEILQLINLAPTSLVEVHLIVEGCEERLGEEKVEELLEIVAKHFPKT